MRLVRTATPILAAALLLSIGRDASAHDEPTTRESSVPEPAAAKHEGTHEEAEKEEEEAEPRWEVIADVAFGATTTRILSEGRVRPTATGPANVFDSTRVSVTSLLLGLEHHFGERLTFGARIPIVQAEFASRTGASDSRSAFIAGNLELEGAYVLVKRKTWNLVGTLEIALPTAGGKEAPTPEEVAAEPDKRYEYRRYDRFAGVHAGAAVRGAYESALFESGNLGLVPKIQANFHFGQLTLSPMVKIENLIDLTGDDEVYINELVVGARASYRVTSEVEPGVHVWMRELHEHSHTDDSFSTVGVIEPFLRFHLGALKPTLSAILPFAGDLADAKTFGIRLSAVAEL